MAKKIKYPVEDGKKICSKCSELKPVSDFSISKGMVIARCKDCINKYYANYRTSAAVKKKMSDYHKAYKLIPSNREKLNKRTSDWRKTTRGRDTRNKSRQAWTLVQKIKAINYKGGCCQICGYNKCTSALEFHHKDSNEKDKYDTGATKDFWTFERKKEELDKCILLCCRCHREVHAKIISL